jgi:hypothetical protein
MQAADAARLLHLDEMPPAARAAQAQRATGALQVAAQQVQRGRDRSPERRQRPEGLMKRLTECPHCGKKNCTALEPPYAFNRKYWCRSCGKTFRKMDARRKQEGWTDEEIAQGCKKSWFKGMPDRRRKLYSEERGEIVGSFDAMTSIIRVPYPEK